MKRFHFLVGGAFILVFLATGQYMRVNFPGAYDGDAGMRMMFRSAHIYILLTAAANFLLGLYWQPRLERWKRRCQKIGSLLIAASPLLMTIAFFVEPAPGKLGRPIVLPTMFIIAAGVLLHAVAGRERRE